MPLVDISLINEITKSGPRLPNIKKWLMSSVWSEDRCNKLEPIKYLKEGEAEVNNFEKLIAATADRVYSEFLEIDSKDKNVLVELSDSNTAVIIFDGMSVRELPMLLSFVKKSGYKIIEYDYAFSAIPSETINFVEQKLGCPAIGPSQLPGRRELTEKGIKTYYLSSNTQSLNIDPQAGSVLVWSSFPDNTYTDSGARFDKHFANICLQLETAWMHSVQRIKGKNRIIITSDHGYVFLDSGLSFERKHSEMRELNRLFGNNRNRQMVEGGEPIDSDDVFQGNGYVMVKGRVHTRSTGTAASHLYKHGGMSLMECFTPWLVLEND